MMEKELFLIDANSLITPYLTFYSFDLVKTFWNQIEVHIKIWRGSSTYTRQSCL